MLGPNGAGKSTIVSMISTILFPTSGEIKVDNKVLGKSPREIKKIMGIVPQDLALYQQLTAKENLHFFGSLYGLSGKQLKKGQMKCWTSSSYRIKEIKMFQHFPGE